MIFAIPLDNDIHEINISMSTSESNIGAIHVTSAQSTHFTGRLPDDIYPLVYYTKSTKGRVLSHGKDHELNVIRTKGNQDKVDSLIFGEADARVFLINKSLLEEYLSKKYSTKNLKSYYAYKTYKIEDADLALFINIHSRMLKNEKISDEEIGLLVSQIFQNPITEELTPGNGYKLVQRTISLMENHLKDPLLIKDLCKILDVSIRTLELAFKKYLNITPKLYYKRLLLLMIETELRNEKAQSVSNVINEYQIYNLSTFGASFKDYFNKTPSEVLTLDAKENPFGWNEKVFLEFSED